MVVHSWPASELVVADVSVVRKSFFPSLPPIPFPLGSLAYRSRRRPTMAEEESARLWQVNRTIHELVKDRVSTR